MRRSGGTRSLLSVSFRRPSCSSSRPRLVCVSLCVCVRASAKGKEKREESVAYHRQRAALDRLQEKHNLASLERERRRNEGAFTRRADRECACPRGKETRRARLKLECPLECCWVVCTGWFSNRRRIERIKPRGNERDEEFNGRPRDIRYTFFRLIDHCTYFEFHLPQNFSITCYLVSSQSFPISRWDYYYFLRRIPSRVSFSKFVPDRMCRKVIDESKWCMAAKKVIVHTTNTTRPSRWGWKRAHAAIYLRESGLF